MKTQEDINGIIGEISRIRERANLLIERELRTANFRGILPAHGAILFFLFQQDKPVAMKDIVEKVGRVKSTVTGMINTLEQYGYVKKEQSPEDGRVMLVKLTDKGRSLKPVAEHISAKLVEKTYGDMPEQHRIRLAEDLHQVRLNLEKE